MPSTPFSAWGRLGWIGKRDRAILLLLYGCGMRVSECLDLRSDDIPKVIRKKGAIITVTGKGNKQRIVPVLPIVIEAVRAYRKACPLPTDGDLWQGFTAGVSFRVPCSSAS